MFEILSSRSTILNSILTLQGDIEQNGQNIERLEKAKGEIVDKQAELQFNKDLVDGPELGASIWTGEHATTFLSIRDELVVSINYMCNTRVEDMLDHIGAEVERLRSLNSSLSDSIASLNRQLDSLDDA
ncbi:hypothetical protein N781_09065 [Pontibacillus halophilus JSM 076056 = DSM 19796]|uniref:Uncharacterized protein n=1 Tax=Pontibacillus halophilus JSM 076056 = DSM 19796 TaxID=1385510 RepID=A0A0A5GF69_9BACI|nr:DUF5082 family protein [Pontibacillus halophilus]KGX89858.1 hypothetical protein N781_09065 [Pontibacillus halophilus JSM 076056 = DSM 19796]